MIEYVSSSFDYFGSSTVAGTAMVAGYVPGRVRLPTDECQLMSPTVLERREERYLLAVWPVGVWSVGGNVRTCLK